MKTKLAITIALASVLASPAFAAPPKHPAQSRDTAESYAQPNEPYVGRQSNASMFANRVIGVDPDQNIRSQMQHDPTPSEY